MRLCKQMQSNLRQLVDGSPSRNVNVGLWDYPIRKGSSSVKRMLSDLKLKGACLENSATYASERRRLRRLYETFDEKGKWISSRRTPANNLDFLVWDSVPPRAVADNPDKPSLTVGKRIIQEMQAMHEAAERRQTEANIRNAREVVKSHWHELKNTTSSSGSIVPRLNEFNALPVVHALLKPKASDGEIDELSNKDSTLNKLVNADVATWEERTRAQFRKILKIPIPKKNQPVDPDTVPPLDRVTSLFECTKCSCVGLGLAQEGTLTFRSAIKHRCKTAPAKKFQWRPDLFRPDSIGIQIARHAVEASGRTEAKTNRKHMDELGPRFLCKICTKPIYLTFGSLIGHMKRHTINDINKTFEYQASVSDLDLKQITSSNGMVEARSRGVKKGFNSTPTSQDFFVCRHCDKQLLWNGLVSHLKEKHRFSDIRDEDFYPKPKPQPKLQETTADIAELL
ncbi:hypothetical protein RhiJN_18879 [Ceratobasidium sp. AG-Ba]|nr:hypothetical protein RhiJN_18879 [Ceratobasidium sp. AG-Ba]